MGKKKHKLSQLPSGSPAGGLPEVPPPAGAGSAEWTYPVAAAFGGLFALTPQAESADPDAILPLLERMNDRLAGVGRCRDQARNTLRLALTRCLTKATITRGRCQDCVQEALRRAHRVATDCCDKNKGCIEQALYGAKQLAWQLAERLGCRMPGGPEADVSPPLAPPAPPGAPSPPIAEYSPERVAVYSPILNAAGQPFVSVSQVGPVDPADADVSGGLQAQFQQAAVGMPPLAGLGFAPLPQQCVKWEKWPGLWKHYNFLQQTVTIWPGDPPRFDLGMQPSQSMNAFDRARFATEISACSRQQSPPPAPSPITGPYPPPGGLPPVAQPFPPPAPGCPVEPDCPKPEPKDWRAWHDEINDECYVTGPGVPPKNKLDRLLYQGPSRAGAERAAAYACEEEKPPEKPPHKKPKRVLGPDWCDPAICERLPGLSSFLDQFLPGDLLKLLGFAGDAVGEVAQKKPKESGLWVGIAKDIGRVLLRTIAAPIGAVWDLGRAVAPCDDPAYVPLAGLRAVLGLAEQFVGPAASDVRLAYDYWARYLCPGEIPSALHAQAAYLADAIDIHQLECWIRANNQCWEPYLTTLEAARSKLTPLELAFAHRRGFLDYDQYHQGMRQLGYLNPVDATNLFDLTEQVPPVSDLIRFMARDADDQTLVAKFGLDDDFAAKWGPKLQGWAKSIGVTEDQARYNWRSHWSIPSPGQLYTFYHRFRKDPKYWRGAAPVDVVKAALSQQDILPYWQDMFLEASFSPINRSDAIAAYDVGVLDEAQLHAAFGQVGYDDPTAQTMVDSRRVFKRRRMRSDRWVRLYRAGGISRQGAEARLAAIGHTPDNIALVLDEALAMSRAESRQKCVISIKRRMMKGEYTPAEAEAELVVQGVDVDQANAIASGWACEKSAKGKHATAANLCKWFELGLITLQEMVDRLEKLGWSRDDAIMVATDCLKRADTRTTKATEAAQRKAELAKAAQERKALRDAKAVERALKQAHRAKEANAKARTRREQLIVDAGQKAAAKLSYDLYPAITEVRRLVELLHGGQAMRLDDSIQAVVDAVESAPKNTTPQELEAVVLQSAAGHGDAADTAAANGVSS